jgi:hypothetical protein
MGKSSKHLLAIVLAVTSLVGMSLVVGLDALPAGAADGTGTMTVSPPLVRVSSTGNTLTFTYTAVGALTSGEVDVVVPTGWSTPSTTSSAAGYSTSSTGTLAVSGSTIQVTALTISSGATCTIVYGSTAGGGPGSTAPSSPQTSPFTTSEKSTSSGTLTGLASSPNVTVANAADGSGTMTVSPTSVSVSSSDMLIFTYTAATGGLNSGEVDVVVPSGWSTPSTTSGTAGYTVSTCGSVNVSAPTIKVTAVTLSSGATCTITYGSGSPGASAPGSSQTSTFTTLEMSTSSGTLTDVASSPTVRVGNSADGSGTMIVSPTSVGVGSTGNTLTFTYTAAAGGLNSGEVDVVVPSGWSAPSTTSSAAGYSTSSSGTLTVSSSTIQVTALTLTGGATCTIVYGSTAGTGPGATASSSSGVAVFTTSEKSTSGGSLTSLSSTPVVMVSALDGSGSMTVSPTSANVGSTGNTLTFTYTASTGGLNSGEVDIVVPSGWSASSTTPSAAGYTTSTSGTVVASGFTIRVTALTLTGGFTCTIVYGSKASSGPGATAPSSLGNSTFTTSEKSTSGGTLTDLASSPSVAVGTAADGTGTMTVSPTSVNVSSNDTLTFTYTAASNGLSSGEVDVVVPSGWTTPSTTSSAAGYSTSSSGTLAVSGSTIQVTALTLSSGATCTIVYGSTAGGGPGSAAPSSSQTSAFITLEKSTSGGTLTDLASSPSVTVTTATHLAFTTQPGNAKPGSALSPQPVVSVENSSDVVISSTDVILLTIWNNPGSGALSCTSNPVTATGGTATYSGCSISNAADGYTLVATDSSNPAVTPVVSSAFDVTSSQSNVCVGYVGNNAFLCSAYEDLLGRTPDPVGLAFWDTQLGFGVSTTAVAYGIVSSVEYRTELVSGYYETFLGRAADPGLSYWVAQLNGGVSDQSVIAGFLGSSEFYAKSGSTPGGFVTAMYGILLGRAPDPGGLGFWETQLSSGVTRSAVAAGILSSTEYRSDFVEAQYMTLLGRAGEAGGISYWVAQLAGGASNESVIANFVGSAEFYAKATA